MTGYRRNFVAGGSFFFVANLVERRRHPFVIGAMGIAAPPILLTKCARRANHQICVQSPSQKYSVSLFTQITSTSLAIPAHTKGRFAIVTNVGQGCDGREWRC
jgi:hypothetical protein